MKRVKASPGNAKKMHNASLVAAICLLLLSAAGCSKKDPVYSCDPGINNWVSKNKRQVENYTRAQLAAIPSVDSQRAIYGALTPEAKYQVWMDKFSAVQQRFKLNDAERQHLQKAKDYFKSDFWTSNETLDQFAPWMDQWGQDAINKLGWDSTKLFLIAENWMMPDELRVIVDQKFTDKANGLIAGATPAPDCGCRYSISCRWLVQNCNTGGGCNDDVYTCGIVGTYRCTGICSDVTNAVTVTQTEIDQELNSYLQ